jgi:hypothetical protein
MSDAKTEALSTEQKSDWKKDMHDAIDLWESESLTVVEGCCPDIPIGGCKWAI